MSSLNLSKDLDRRFEYAKAFYIKAKKCDGYDEKKTMIEVCFALSFSFLEGTLFYVADHFSEYSGEFSKFHVFEHSIMLKKELKIEKGKPCINMKRSRYRSIEEKLQFLFWKFSHKQFDTSQRWWQLLLEAIAARNRIMHPKYTDVELKEKDAENCLTAVMGATDALFRTVFNKPWPKAKKGLDASITV